MRRRFLITDTSLLIAATLLEICDLKADANVLVLELKERRLQKSFQ